MSGARSSCDLPKRFDGIAADCQSPRFRQDLISERRQNAHGHEHHHHLGEMGEQIAEHMHIHPQEHTEEKEQSKRAEQAKRPSIKKGQHSEALFRADRRRRHLAVQNAPVSSATSQVSINSENIVSQLQHDKNRDGVFDDDRQDILEVWFAGQHGDVGGGKLYSFSTCDTAKLQEAD